MFKFVLIPSTNQLYRYQRFVSMGTNYFIYMKKNLELLLEALEESLKLSKDMVDAIKVLHKRIDELEARIIDLNRK